MLAPLVVFGIITALVVGIAIDFVRHDRAQAELQAALDHGVYIAVGLTQHSKLREGMTDREIIEACLRQRNLDPSTMSIVVTAVESGDDAKLVEAEASYDMPTYALRVLGIFSLRVPAYARAERGRVDVSLTDTGS